MQVLVIGNGGREHALAWKLAQSQKVDTVYVAPGNAGTALEPNIENIDIAVNDFEKLSHFAQQKNIDLTVVGPEGPLVDGIVDHFSALNLRCFGPSAKAAQLEGSKSFTKDFLARHNIPTAEYETFTDQTAALNYVRDKGAPIVVKADGLAAGKGVIVAMTLAEAEAAIIDMLAGNAFGDAGHKVVIEEFLEGEEASFIVVSDGVNILPMATSQDHKRIGEGDTGPNTGGMGAYSPAPVVTAEVHDRIMREVIEPTVAGMAAEGNTYSGFLYAGLMIDAEGTPKVIEYNCRFGDPETQPIMMRMQSDLSELCIATVDKQLAGQSVQWANASALGVVLAAGGYPESYKKGLEIEGLNTVNNDNCKVFHAGTVEQNEKVLTSGGRVLCVTALGESVEKAQALAYENATKITWPGVQLRKDIGYRAVARERSKNA